MLRVLIFILFEFLLGAETRWEVRTCSGCKLNRLHEVRKFIKDEAKSYGLNVKYIQGRNPDLVFIDDSEKETEIIDLSPLSRNQIRKLVESKGFRMMQDL